jgi:hypothetical protein
LALPAPVKEFQKAKSAMLEAVEPTAGRKKRVRKPRSATLWVKTSEPKAKVARISDELAVHCKQEADAQLEWVCERRIEENEIAGKPWIAQVAQMW